MILVTLGTQDKKFYRILEYIQELINRKVIKEEVIVQAGVSSDFKSNNMKIVDLLPMEEFDSLISKCDVLITHGGVGSIITGLKNNKKVIAIARLKKYGEHVNDHQLQIISNFVSEGYILSFNSCEELEENIKKIDKFKPKKYKENNNNFIKLLKNEIDKYF